MELSCLDDDDDWAQFCFTENNSPATVLEVEGIVINSDPPLHLLEIALSKLSQIVRFSTNLSRIDLHGEMEPFHHVVAAVCEALIHSRVQQKIQIKFDFGDGITCEQFFPVTNLMKNCKREIELCIGCGGIQDDGVSDLMKDALRHMSGSIAELDLSCLGLGDDEACALSENLMVNTTLVSLDLHHNEIGDKGANALADALKHNGALTELDLSYNSIGRKGGVAIGHALLCNRTLEELYLGENAIGDEGALALAAGLRGGSSLKELCVDDARIGKKGGVAFGEALAFSSTLETLHIHRNPIGDEGAVAIASSLVRNATLKLLWLCYIGMGTEGCSALAGALRSNASLTGISIGYNQIGDEGVVGLADALKDNMSLKTLLMRYSNIGDEGAIALAEAIASNATLNTLDLWENPDITEDIGIAALVNGLDRNSTLTVLNLSWKHWSTSTRIKFPLRRNRALSKEPAWMKRFSDQDIPLKSRLLSKATGRYSLSEFSELTFLFLKSQVSTITATHALTHASR